MLTPPPVSAAGHPTAVGSQSRSNYLAAGLVSSTAYNDNVLAGSTTGPAVSDVTYSISPTVSINKATTRQQLELTYSPGFTFYLHTSTLNTINQNADVNFEYRLSPHTTVSLSDSLQKNSNAIDQIYPVSGAPISGSSQTPPIGVVAPYADQLRNTANLALSYQFARDDMIGASGIFARNNYLDPTEASDFYNSNSLSGSAFYNHRLSSTRYIGVTYQYSWSQSNPVIAQANPALSQPEVHTHTFSAFYTIYLNPTLSFSLSSGPQYTVAVQTPSPASSSWTPFVMASIGWQSKHTNIQSKHTNIQSKPTNIIATYSRTVTGGLGLPGAYTSHSANASVSWQLARTWTVEAAVSYSNSENITPNLPSSLPGGQGVSGTASMQHPISEHLNMELGYTRLRQNYVGIPAISAAPDSNRAFISISYQLNRPWGR
jgi:hypothetical protein